MRKNSLFTGQPVFTQLLNLIPRQLIDQASRKHRSNFYCKRFMAYDHLVTMLYAGYFQCTSLRELTTGLQANALRLNHLGLKHTPRRSTLSDANRRRSDNFFAEVFHALYKKYFGLPDSRRVKKDDLFIVDSTTIGLFNSVMRGAGAAKANGKKKGGVKAHMMIDAQHDVPAFVSISEAREHDLTFLRELAVPEGSTIIMDMAYVNYRHFKTWNNKKIRWVTRLRSGASIQPVIDNPVNESSYDAGVLRDQVVLLGRPSNRNKTPLINARIVSFFDHDNKRSFSFLTNDMESEPEVIAQLYKQRWQIELLFKRIKQRYPLKYFLGDNPNAIKIQIWTALLCDLLVKVIQTQINKIKSKPWAYASISSMIRHHLMTYINLKSFLLNPEKSLTHYKPPSNQMDLFYRGAYF
jgi:hypothetical protein